MKSFGLGCAALAVFAFGCTFDSGGLALSGDGGADLDAAAEDGPIDPLADAEPGPDAPPPPVDAAPTDAAPPPGCGDGDLDPGEQCDDGNKIGGDGCDGSCAFELGECPAGIEMYTLPAGQTMTGTTAGEPSLLASNVANCGGTSAGEDVWVLSLAVAADVTFTTNLNGTAYDTALYVRRDCQGASLGCQSAAALGDSLTLTDLVPGLYYVIVDGVAGANGAYAVRADVKPILGEGAVCDPQQVMNRCKAGTTCSSSGGGGTPTCQSDKDLCAGSATALALTVGTVVSGATGGTSTYEAACLAGASTGETVYKAVVPAGGARDLVVDVNATGNFNPVVAIDAVCGEPTSEKACQNTSTVQDRDEVAVIPNVAAGTYFPIVDGAGNQSGAYALEAWLRPVVGLAESCDRSLRASRCGVGVCVDAVIDLDEVPSCALGVTEIADSDDNQRPCGTPMNPAKVDGPANTDFVYKGVLNRDGDFDVIKLAPLIDSTLIVSAFTDGGACAIDLSLTIAQINCAGPNPNPTILFSDDDSGIGACPVLITGPKDLKGGQEYFLAISRPTNFGTGSYQVVVDFLP
jgi:cysteine-rich repeat protein